ncbi:MAG: nucleotidyltransferase family protein [Christensenellaceae bacterium]
MDKELLFKIMNSAVKGETLPENSAEQIDEKALLCLKEQTFLPFLYPVFNDDRFIDYYVQSFAVHERFNFIINKIKEVLSAEKIRHIFLKGSELKSLYKDENLRALGDVDFLVDEKDYQRARQALQKAGFKLKNVQENETIMIYDNLNVELHNKLYPNESVGSKFFSRPFSHAVLAEDYTYKLENNYNYLYIITHYVKHLSSGAGLRPLCDIYLMTTMLDLNWSEVESGLKQLKLDKFFNTLLHELNIVFGYDKIPFTPNDWTEKLLEYSIESGIHGYGKKGDAVGNAIHNSFGGSKIKYLWKRLFIPIKYLFLRYPWTKSIILIPFGYLFRFIELLITRGDKFKAIISNKSEGETFLENVGLDFKELK